MRLASDLDTMDDYSLVTGKKSGGSVFGAAEAAELEEAANATDSALELVDDTLPPDFLVFGALAIGLVFIIKKFRG